jgi:hypothetical protein
MRREKSIRIAIFKCVLAVTIQDRPKTTFKYNERRVKEIKTK